MFSQLMADETHYVALATLETGLPEIRRAPIDHGTLELIVRRPGEGRREVITEAQLDVADGLIGDAWKARRSTRTADGSITCVPGPQHGFEWTNNAVAIDTNGDVYANSADGNLYAITQSGVLKQNIFLERAVNAAGTPLSIGADGKIYTQNFGQLIPVGT